ncbi:MAG: rod shape-determining protein MreC [Anaerolineae bacterium]|nr:rod shape-determining protein MreC [Anaerolineae bacterium]
MRLHHPPNRLITLGILIVIAMCLILAGSRLSILRTLTGVVMAPISPVARTLTGGADLAAGLTGDQPDYATLREHERELERTVARLQIEIVQLKEIEQDYHRLSGLLDYKSAHQNQNLVTADVIARDTSGYLRWVIINRGVRDGIRIGNPVISDQGLVGYVDDIAANTAWVRLIIDQSSAVNARLQNARAEGTVFGQLQGTLLMGLIPQEMLIEPDDMVLTSGLGGKFPAGIVIGQVTSVQRQPAELFQQAQLRPMVDFGRLEIVSVITSFQTIDTTIFETGTE